MWQEHCSHIKIRAPCNDTCGECTVFRNAFCYQESRKMVPEAEEKCHSSDDYDNSITGRNASPPRPEDDLEDVSATMILQEKLSLLMRRIS
jgi:hypothetical protein